MFTSIAVFVANQMFANAGVWCVSYTMATLHVVSVSGSGIVAFAVIGPTRSNMQMIWEKCTSTPGARVANDFRTSGGSDEEIVGFAEDREDPGFNYGSFPA